MKPIDLKSVHLHISNMTPTHFYCLFLNRKYGLKKVKCLYRGQIDQVLVE